MHHYSMTRQAVRVGAGVAVLMLGTGAVFAGGFAIREQSSYYQGTSFAGYSTASDSISTMFWNPATLTAHKGMKSEVINSVIVPRSDIDVESAVVDSSNTPLTSVPGAATGDAGDIGIAAWVPGSYGSYQFNDQVYLGLSMNAPFGLSTKPNTLWSGQTYARSSEALSFNVTPNVAFKLSDSLSLGVGLQMQYFQVRLKRARTTSVDAPGIELRGEDQNLGIGATFGLLYEPMEGTQIGFGYRSPVNQSLDGYLIVGSSETRINAEVLLPESVNVSFKHAFMEDRARVMGTFEYTHWGRFNHFAIYNDLGRQISGLEFFYDDGYYLALGGEYDFNAQWTGRAGIAYEWSPIDEEVRTARLPDSDRLWLSAGLSYTYTDWLSFDLGYTHIFPESAKIDYNPQHHDYNGISLRGDVDASVDILSAAMRVVF